MLSSVLVSKADQLAYLTESQAIKAVSFLKKQKQVILWCACCDDDAQQLISISDVGYRYTGSDDFYEVYVEGTDDTGTKKTYDLDLAYVHYLLMKKAYCVGKVLGFECDPCTEPFYHNVKVARKLPKIENYCY